MRTYVYPADEFGCGHYRMIWPAHEAVKRGMDIELIDPGSRTQLGAQLNGDGSIKSVIYPDDAEIIVIQRPTHRYLSEAVPILRRQGVTVVVDMDDDLRTIHPRNPAFRMLHPKDGGMHSWQNAAEACRNASLVTVSTDALAVRYGRHGRVEVLRNCIPRRFLDVPHVDSEVVGWGGSVHSHPNDLQEMGSSISSFVKSGGRFAVVGSGDDVARILGLDDNPDSTGVVDFDAWPDALTNLGVGVAPLADTIFNSSKSWLKPLEYAAVGVPWVASDRSEYRRLAELGCGTVVPKPRDWDRAIKRMTGDANLRADMSAAGRAVAEKLTFESNGHRWVAAWQRARENDTSLVGGRA